MSDTFLPGSGFDTYESQDKVLVQMDGSRECAVAVRILQQQGFAVAGAAVRLAAEQTADAESAKKAAEALGIECIVLNAEALAGQAAQNKKPPNKKQQTNKGCNMWQPLTVPGWRPVQTACTPSARPQAPAVMTARFLQLCRRKRWHG